MNPSVAVQRSTPNSKDKHLDGETEFKIEYFVLQGHVEDRSIT